MVEAFHIEETYVKELIRKSMPGLFIDSVLKVNNNFLEGMYLLTREEFRVCRPNIDLNERNLLHVTSQASVPNIISNNLSRMYTTRAVNGKAVYFSDEAKLANQICNPTCGLERAIIVCKVIVGNSQYLSRSYTILPEGVDTGLTYDGRVFVKFCDHEFLPLFVAFYEYRNR